MSVADSAALRSYVIDVDALFGAFSTDINLHRDTMSELVDRYELRDKRILGVGPGDCAQEYFFHTNNNSLFLVDIDESGNLEPLLVNLAAQRRSDNAVTYVIGDARHVGGWLKAKFDVIFTSGFTPDEAHRAETLAKFTETARNRGLLNEIGVWPPDTGPLSRLCEEVIEEGLGEGGLFIMLSYASGPDIVRARNYLPALETQLERLGMSLVEAHCLAQAPGVHLIVAQKDSTGRTAKARRAQFAHRKPLSIMHARTTFDHTPIRLTPGPAMLGAGRPGQGPLPANLKARLEDTIGAALDRFAPAARTAYYAGNQLETEGLYLLCHGLTLDYGWYDQTHAPAEGVRHGLIHPQPIEDEATASPHRYDVCLLSFIGRDEKARTQANAEGNRADVALFGPDTLADVHRMLKPEGVLLYQGRTGGVDPLEDRSFGRRVRAALWAGGFEMLEMHVARTAPGFFFFAGRPAPLTRTVAKPFRIIAGLEADNTAAQIWPPFGRRGATAASGAGKAPLALTPALSDKLDGTLGQMIARLLPTARTALYAGNAVATEGQHLVELGFDVTMLGDGAPGTKALAAAPTGPFDLCLLWLPAAETAGNSEIFAAGALDALHQRLDQTGKLICRGRTNERGGADAAFAGRVKIELAARGLCLLEFYAMQQQPELFTFVASRTICDVPEMSLQADIFAGDDADTAALRLWPLAAIDTGMRDRLDATIGSVVGRYRCNSGATLYAGAYAATEARYLIDRGLDVTIGSPAQLDPAACPAATFDLCFLSFLAADDELRAGASAARAAKRGDAVRNRLARGADKASDMLARLSEPLFRDDTLEAARRILSPGGVLIYQGRTGGANPLRDWGYARAVKMQLARKGFRLAEMYVMKEAPGVFVLAARPAAFPNPDATPIRRIFAAAQVDNSAVRIWPRW